jgi:Tfp pilus assembly major pilin PilA
MTLSVEFFLASVDDAVAVAAVVIALAAADNVAVKASVVDMLRD